MNTNIPLFDIKHWLAYWNALITWDEALPSLKKRPDPEILEQSPTMRRYELYIYQAAYVFLINGLLITCISTRIWPFLLGLIADLMLIFLQLKEGIALETTTKDHCSQTHRTNHCAWDYGNDYYCSICCRIEARLNDPLLAKYIYQVFFDRYVKKCDKCFI